MTEEIPKTLLMQTKELFADRIDRFTEITEGRVFFSTLIHTSDLGLKSNL